MKNITILLVIATLLVSECVAQKPENKKSDNSVVDFYCQYSETTDPGEFTYLYNYLPDSLLELCQLIKSQSVHPYAELPRYRQQFPEERWNEMTAYSNVKSTLRALDSLDSRGLIPEREIKNKLIVGCWHNSLLLASIMKYRGIPARMRYGHATYIIPNFHGSHVICEVWNESEKRWMLVDPSTAMVDFDSSKFDFSNEAWQQLQNGEIDPDKFGIPGKYSGPISIVSKVCGDLCSILGTEPTIFQYSPMLDYAFKNNNTVSSEHIKILNTVSELMNTLNAENIAKLQDIYDNTPGLHFTLSMF